MALKCLSLSLLKAPLRCQMPMQMSAIVRSSFHTHPSLRKTFEPDYLDNYGYIPPKLQMKMNIQIKGYDFSILENYQKYIHSLVENMGIDVSECWATPRTSWSASTYEEGSPKVKDTYKVHIYERNVQVENLFSTDVQILLDLLRKTCPEGVSLSMHEHQTEHFEARFIPDPFIEGIRKELEVFEEKRRAAREEKEAKKK